jgi:hypothetical protein
MSFVERNLPQLRDDENPTACVAHAESEVAAAEEAVTEANAAAAEASNAVSAAQDEATELRATSRHERERDLARAERQQARV